MKTKLFLLFMLAPLFAAFSQKDYKADYEKKRGEMKAQKVSFITEQLSLTPEEAQKFWSLYNEMQAKKQEIQKDLWQLRKEKKAGNVDFEKWNETNINAGLKEAELEREYYEKYKQILSAEKIFKLYQAEKEFQKQLLEKIRHGNRPNKPLQK